MNEELKHLFTPGPLVSFRCSRKISSCLVKAKLYPVERSDSFTSTFTGETYKINHKFDCIEKCLIFLLTCNNMYVKQLTLFAISGIITDLTLLNMHMTYHACRNTCTKIFVIVNVVVFLMTSQ